MAKSKTTAKVLTGSLALIIRQAITTPITALGLIILSRTLTPADFGLQSVATLVTSSSFLLIDAGITQSLVQCRSLPTPTTIHQIRRYKYSISFLLVLILLCSTYYIGSLSALGIRAAPAFLAMCVAAGLLQSERGLAAVELQRLVSWKPLAKIEVWEVVTQTTVGVVIAVITKTAWAFPVGIAARFLCGAILLKKHPKQPVVELLTNATPATLLELLRFGIPTQVTSGLSLLQNAIIPIVLGATVGLEESGLLVWSMSIASLPILPLQVLTSLLFSLGSDLRRNDSYDKSLLNDLMHLTLLSATLWGALFAFAMPFGIGLVFGLKWVKAIPLVSMLIVGNICVWFNAVLTSQIHAFGFSAERMKFAFAEFVMLWALSGIGSLVAGSTGYCIGFVLAQIVLLLGLTQVLGGVVNVDLKPWRCAAIVCACGAIVFLLNVIRSSPIGMNVSGAAVFIIIVVMAQLLNQAIKHMRSIPIINENLPRVRQK